MTLNLTRRTHQSTDELCSCAVEMKHNPNRLLSVWRQHGDEWGRYVPNGVGAGYRSRTDDLAITNRTLYQLS